MQQKQMKQDHLYRVYDSNMHGELEYVGRYYDQGGLTSASIVKRAREIFPNMNSPVIKNEGPQE